MAPLPRPTKPKSPPPQRKPARGVISRLLWGWVLQPGRFLVALVGIGLLAAIPSAPWLLPRLAELPEYQYTLADIELPQPHRWVPKNLMQQAARESQLPEQVSLLENNLAAEVAGALRQHPWIREVKSVRVAADRRIVADVLYRIPAAFVEVDNGTALYPVDSEGVLLPPADFSMADTTLLPHLRGVTTRPRGPAGSNWGDEAVTGGARLAALLAPEQNLEAWWNRLGMDSILAHTFSQSGEPDRITLEIALRNGHRVVWGRPPGVDALEQPADKKLARLDWLERKGTLTAPAAPDGPKSIDISLIGETVRIEPLDVRWR